MKASSQNIALDPSLRANISWTLLGNLVYAACQWGMLILLTKLGSPYSVGQFALGLAITAPVITLANLQLRGVQATDARNTYQFRDYLFLRLITTLLALLIIAGTVLASGYSWNTTLIILMIGATKGIEAISDIFYGLFQRHEKMEFIARSMLIKGPLSLLGLGIGVALIGSVFWGVVGIAIAWVWLLLSCDLPNALRLIAAKPITTKAANLSLCRNWRTLNRLTFLALPLGVVMFLISLNINIPRYFIEYHWGEQELGIFSALSYFQVVGTTVVGALGQSASPRLSKYYAAGNRKMFCSLMLKLLGTGALLGVIGVLLAAVAGNWFLHLVYGSAYAQIDLFILLMSAAGLSYIASLLGYTMTAARYFRSQMPLTVCTVLVCTLLSAWLVPDAGVHGAAIALIVSTGVWVLGSVLINAHALNKL